MSIFRLRYHGPAWLALLLIGALLAACVAPTPPPSVPTNTPPPPSAAFECSELKTDAVDSGGVATAHYILNQVIVTGPTEAVQAVIEELGGAEAGFVALQTCVMIDRRAEAEERERWNETSGSRGDAPAILFPSDVAGQLSTSLYAFPTDRSTEETVNQINEIGRDKLVFADPNYLTGPLDANPVSPCAIQRPDAVGAPFEVGGSPFEVGGSPFEVGGSSSGGLGDEADPADFWPQWAFEQIGLHFNGSGRGTLSGKGITVAIFDTSPYTPTMRSASISDQNGSLDLALAFVPPINALLPNPAPDANGAPTQPVDVADHGLFAAGLVHAVAPASDLYLIEVLNDYGCGDLWTLNRGINTFVAQQMVGGRLDDVVLNLSLGVHQPRDHRKAGWPPQIVSLDEALRNAASRGAVIVAASGNDSYASLDPRPMQLPADWRYVIGVAASSQLPSHACYSNLGDVTAPGADGRASTGDRCQPRANECRGQGAACPFGLISLATGSSTGYRYWVGTSFAAPLVSGQAALLLERNVAARAVPRCIHDTMAGNNGQRVISIPASVRDCVTP
jgi:hypothetical protein